MPRVGYELWYFEETAEYGEPVAPSGIVFPLPSDVILYRGMYLSPDQATTQGLLQAQQWMQTPGNIVVLRPVHSSDGPPFRTVLLYTPSGSGAEVLRGHDPRIPHAQQAFRMLGTPFYAVRSGSRHSWVTHSEQGTPGFFITGSSGMSALWRVTRVEGDALDRQVVTLAPIRLAHGVIAADFSSVTDTTLRQHLEQHFAAFQRAVSAGAHFDMIDRAYNLAEAILAHSLTVAGRAVPPNLAARLAEARKVLDAKGSLGRMTLSEWGYTLAEKMRHLHKQLHADQAVTRGQTVRPEVGMTLTADVSELLRDAGLGRY